MLAKLLETPSLHGLLPFVHVLRVSCYKWVDENGAHDIRQAEGGEQRDPLVPLLFSLALDNALQEVQEQLHPGELLFAFLDDVYAVAAPNRNRPIYDLLGAKLFERAGIRLHTGRTRTWNRDGQRPPVMEDLGPDEWSQESVKILGTPLGSDVHCHQHHSQIGGRGETVGGCVVGVGPTMCLANRSPVCGTSLPPLLQDRGPQPVPAICRRPRRGNVEGS